MEMDIFTCVLWVFSFLCDESHFSKKFTLNLKETSSLDVLTGSEIWLNKVTAVITLNGMRLHSVIGFCNNASWCLSFRLVDKTEWIPALHSVIRRKKERKTWMISAIQPFVIVLQHLFHIANVIKYLQATPTKGKPLGIHFHNMTSSSINPKYA